MQLLKRDSVKIMDQQYNTECEIYFSIQKREADVLLESLKKIENLKLSVWNP